MRLLLINQFFWPDSAPTARFLTDLARAVQSSGEVEVTAICGATAYGATDPTPPPHARILRPSASRFSRSTLGRIFSYASFLAGAAVAGFRVGRPDTVVTLTTPPLTSVFGRILKLLRGCRHFIWEMDVYPDIAVDVGAFQPRSLLTSIIGALADWSRRNADGIIVLGDDMKARLIARDIPEHKIHVAGNWADGSEIAPLPFPPGPLVIHYSGNFGLAHDLDTIAAVIRRFSNDPRFQFVFAGGGVRRTQLEKICRDEHISNASFPPYSTRAALAQHLSEGHLGLVTQLPQTCGSIVPSKVYGILAAGRPLLYIGPREATPARILDRFGCGWRIAPGDSSSLAALLEKLAAERNLVYDAGGRARQAFEHHFDLPAGVSRIVQLLGLATAEGRELASSLRALSHSASQPPPSPLQAEAAEAPHS